MNPWPCAFPLESNKNAQLTADRLIPSGVYAGTYSNRAGQGRAGQGRAGQGRAGQGRAGQGRAGQGRAGQGRAGQGRAGQGRAGQGRTSSTRTKAGEGVGRGELTESQIKALVKSQRHDQLINHEVNLPYRITDLQIAIVLAHILA